MYYAIEKTGAGSRIRFQIKKVYESGLVCPVTTSPETYKRYSTEDAARAAAAAANIEIRKTGDFYAIIANG